MHAVYGDHGHEDHAEDAAHEARVADGDGHGQHADTDVPLQQVDDRLHVGDGVGAPLRVLRLGVSTTALLMLDFVTTIEMVINGTVLILIAPNR